VWVIARPPGGNRHVLESQVSAPNATAAIRRLSEGGWIAVSKQIAEEQHTGVGRTLTLPTPTGEVSFRMAATTTNLAWPPGVIFMATGDYSHYWNPTHPTAPTALGVQLRPGTNLPRARNAIERALGSTSGLEISTAAAREARIDALAGEGLGQLGQISTLLEIAAILALATAGASAVWQRRRSLAELRFDGVKPPELWRVLLVESALILGAGCLTGAVLGIYGQLVIDAYLKHITGFPVASLAASFRPLEILALVSGAALTLVAIPAWRASHADPMLVVHE
jgi:putative ABC transport system permease protein